MSINIGWPEGIYLLLNILSLPLIARSMTDDAKTTAGCASIVLWVFLTLPLLYWGGFFA
jgi:hypothetical protein